MKRVIAIYIMLIVLLAVSLYAAAWVLAFMLTLFICAMSFRWKWEAKEWNDGVCAENSIPWELQGFDSQDRRVYNAGVHTCWISYPVDRQHRYCLSRF